MKERRDMACSSASVRSIIFYIDGASLVETQDFASPEE